MNDAVQCQICGMDVTRIEKARTVYDEILVIYERLEVIENFCLR